MGETRCIVIRCKRQRRQKRQLTAATVQWLHVQGGSGLGGRGWRVTCERKTNFPRQHPLCLDEKIELEEWWVMKVKHCSA
jgi:hypothetical protein